FHHHIERRREAHVAGAASANRCCARISRAEDTEKEPASASLRASDPEWTRPGEREGGSGGMSWQAYVDDHLLCDIDVQRLAAAAILGHDGSVWAQSDAFPQVKPEEINGIMNDFNEPGSLAPTGLYLGGSKYMVIQGEPGAVIRGKKGPGGVTIKKTNLAIIIGIYEEPVTPGQCNMVVEGLGDYLVDQGI
ncbi:unnamed protein product, partial [Urochloa humidicola]